MKTSLGSVCRYHLRPGRPSTDGALFWPLIDGANCRNKGIPDENIQREENISFKRQAIFPCALLIKIPLPWIF